MTNNAARQIATARIMIRKRTPYFFRGVLNLIPREEPRIPTLAVSDKAVMLYNPEFVAGLPLLQTAGVVVHELFHYIRDHHGRRAALNADPELWNIAGDLEINDNVIELGYELPEGCLMPAHYGLPEGKIAEFYYNELVRQAKKDPGGKKPGEGDGKEGEGDEGETGKPGTGKPKDGVGKGKCGGCAGNKGAHEPTDGRSKADASRIAKNVAEGIRHAAAKNAKKGEPGYVPGGLVVWADGVLGQSKVNWRRHLARVIRVGTDRPGMVDYTFSRVSRRQYGLGGFNSKTPILPAFRAANPRVAVALDTSGSMGEEEVRDALAEVKGILRSVTTPITFVACDSQVHTVKAVRGIRELKDAVKGGGGTDFRPVFNTLAKDKGGRFDFLVFITDGHGEAPPTAPVGTRVVWVLVGKGAKTPAPWGEVVRVED